MTNAAHDFAVLAAAYGLAQVASGQAQPDADPQTLGAPDVALVAAAYCLSRDRLAEAPSGADLRDAVIGRGYFFFDVDLDRRARGRARVVAEANLNLAAFKPGAGCTTAEHEAYERIERALRAHEGDDALKRRVESRRTGVGYGR